MGCLMGTKLSLSMESREAMDQNDWESELLARVVRAALKMV